MDASTIRSYHALYLARAHIARSNNLFEALVGCMRICVDELSATLAVLWVAGAEGDDLRPLYWLAPYDLTSCACQRDSTDVGRAYVSEQSTRTLSPLEAGAATVFSAYPAVKVSSSFCAPCSGKDGTICVMQLLTEQGQPPLADEECDMVEIMAMIASMGHGRDERPWQVRVPAGVLMSARDVTREFESGESVVQVLRGIDLDVYEGEFLVLLGESGCGKSTLLNIMGGMDFPNSGSFRFDGEEHLGASEHELAVYRREQVGFIFQNYNLMPNLRARQNLNLIGELSKNPMPTEEALALVGLGDRINSKPSQLSGGQQQRVSIARAIVKRPRVIFADEPTAALDYETSVGVLDVIDRIAQEGTTVVMVTHNEQICRMADRVVRLRLGRVYEVAINRKRAKAQDLVW